MIAKIRTSSGARILNLPDCWIPNGNNKTPCTTATYQRMMAEWDGADLVKLFSIFSGVDYAVISNAHDYVLEEQLIKATRFVYSESMSWKEAKPPETFTIQGKTVKVPKTVWGFSIGQSIRMRQALDTAKVYEKDGHQVRVLDEFIALAVACYLQPLVDGGAYNDDRTDELLPIVEQMPIAQTYSLGFFLLRKLIKRGLIGRMLFYLQSILSTRR